MTLNDAMALLRYFTDFTYNVVLKAFLRFKLSVSQKNVPPLQLAIIFTYTVRWRQFLA